MTIDALLKKKYYIPSLFRFWTDSGEAVLPLDTRFVGGNREVVLKLRDPDKRNRGFVRVEAFWVDEAKPRKETGDFYYKVYNIVVMESWLTIGR